MVYALLCFFGTIVVVSVVVAISNKNKRRSQILANGVNTGI